MWDMKNSVVVRFKNVMRVPNYLIKRQLLDVQLLYNLALFLSQWLQGVRLKGRVCKEWFRWNLFE